MEYTPAHKTAAMLLAIDEYLGMVDEGTDWEINFIISQMEGWIEKKQPRTASQLQKITEIYNNYYNKDTLSVMNEWEDFVDDSKLDFITGENKTI